MFWGEGMVRVRPGPRGGRSGSCLCSRAAEHPRGEHLLGGPVRVGHVGEGELAREVRSEAVLRAGAGRGVRHHHRLQHPGTAELASEDLRLQVGLGPVVAPARCGDAPGLPGLGPVVAPAPCGDAPGLPGASVPATEGCPAPQRPLSPPPVPSLWGHY